MVSKCDKNIQIEFRFNNIHPFFLASNHIYHRNVVYNVTTFDLLPV
jgi:hypothetical protein